MSLEANPSQDLGRCKNCKIRHRAVCGALSDEELKLLSQVARQRFFKPGQIIISDDEPSQFFANVISGVVKLSKNLEDGRQQIVGLLFPPDFLGRAHSTQSAYFAEAATNVELCCFPHLSFERMLRDYPNLESRLFTRTLDELDSAREWMLLLGRKTATEKVASFLEMVARRSLMVGCAHSGPEHFVQFELPLTRADVADYLGLTIETVSRQITRLKGQKIINLIDNRHFEVPDLKALVKVAGLDENAAL